MSEICLYYDCSWQLTHFILIVSIEWFLHTHILSTGRISSLFFLAAGQKEHLPCRLPQSSITLVGEAICRQGKYIALMALWVYLLMFPLSVFLLICGLTIYSPREIWYTYLWWFLFFPIRTSQPSQCKCTYTSNINQAEEQFQIPALCWSRTSVFLYKLVQNIRPHF